MPLFINVDTYLPMSINNVIEVYEEVLIEKI